MDVFKGLLGRRAGSDHASGQRFAVRAVDKAKINSRSSSQPAHSPQPVYSDERNEKPRAEQAWVGKEERTR